MTQPLTALFELDRIAMMFRKDIQQDKRTALLALADLMRAADASYVVTGGLAVQRHVSRPRFTQDLDVVVRPEDEAVLHRLLGAEFADQFQLVHRKRNWTALIHTSSGTPVDINSSRLFQRLLTSPESEALEGRLVPFASAVQVAYTKLRTQHPRWPRSAQRRVQDRADLMALLQDNPGLADELERSAEEPLREILAEIQAECGQVVEEYPDFPEE